MKMVTEKSYVLKVKHWKIRDSTLILYFTNLNQNSYFHQKLDMKHDSRKFLFQNLGEVRHTYLKSWHTNLGIRDRLAKVLMFFS